MNPPPAQYQAVRIISDRYCDDGIHKGDIGYIVEIYDEQCCEVEFSRPDGSTYALQAIRLQDLVPADP